MIEIDGLTKVYHDRRRGKLRAVNDVSFTSHPGEIFGLIGPNGAGKTTTLRIIATALRPTSGTARVLGFDTVRQSEEVRRRIGFLSAHTALYGRLSAREHFQFFGRLFQMDEKRIGHRTGELSAEFQMQDFLDRPVEKLSTGMKQKVSIARSIFHSPDVIVLDEPTTGLDVLTSRTIISFIRRCRKEKRTVLFSSHIMTEVELLCDRVAIIHEGAIYFIGSLDELRAKHGKNLEDAFISAVGAEP